MIAPNKDIIFEIRMMFESALFENVSRFSRQKSGFFCCYKKLNIDRSAIMIAIFF